MSRGERPRAEGFTLQFTARKRDENGKPYRWRHVGYATRELAEAAAAKRRKQLARTVRVEVVGPKESHGERTRAGMARARAAGRRIGRPRVKFDLRNVRAIMREWDAMGRWYRTSGLRSLAESYGVSVSTLERRLRQKG